MYACINTTVKWQKTKSNKNLNNVLKSLQNHLDHAAIS